MSSLPVLIVTATRERTFQLKKEIGCLIKNDSIPVFTGMGSSIFLKDKKPDYQSLASRLNTVKNLRDPESSTKMIIAAASSLTNLTPAARIKDLDILNIERARECDRDMIIEWLIKNGYERVNQVYDRGEFSVKGDIINIFDITSEKLLQINLLIDEIEKILLFEPGSLKNIRELEKISVFPNRDLWSIDPGSRYRTRY